MIVLSGSAFVEATLDFKTIVGTMLVEAMLAGPMLGGRAIVEDVLFGLKLVDLIPAPLMLNSMSLAATLGNSELLYHCEVGRDAVVPRRTTSVGP